MNQLHNHYRLLLGLDEFWQVQSVDLSLEEHRVEIHLERHGKGQCPDCGVECPLADHGPERAWRHLDTMQFETRIVARVPRTRCEKCGVKTMEVPWAGKHSRFTLMFEAFAIDVMQSCSSVSKAAGLLRLNWRSAHQIMQRAVERGLERRQVDEVKHCGMDEKSFRKGHRYISLLIDLDSSRVLEVAEDRTEDSARKLWETLPESQRRQVKAVAMDMWKPYENAASEMVPEADVVHDKFHVAKHINEAVDQVRRAENKLLLAEGNGQLKGTKQLWLFREDNLPETKRRFFDELKEANLKTSRAWAIKENLTGFWTYFQSGSAKRYFDRWYGWAARSRLKPIIKVAKMIKRHLPNILTYFKHRITNATSEGFNSRIQSIKSAARGFHAFENYRTRILFYCGKLDMKPAGISH
jgi:transposase